MATNKVKRYNGEEDGSEVESGPDTETSPVYTASAKGEDLPPMDEAPAKAAPAKAKIVTKEELAKSGLSLRDYLNKQQGLTRRGESTPTKAAPAKEASAPAKAASAPAKRLLAPETSAPVSSSSPQRGKVGKSDEEAPRRGVTRVNMEDLKGRMKGMGGASGFASGGSVSASRRGDGIASKGKTRGRMC